MTAPAGTGVLEIVRAPARSIVLRAFATSPLRLLTPRSHGQAAWAYTGSYGGGLVDADSLRLTLRVGADACAFLSTQASTKVYRSPAGTSVAVDAQLSSGAVLVVWPDPVVCFAGSGYHQRQQFELDKGAALVLIDWMTSGRRASGERWRFARYASSLTVRYDGNLVLRDAVFLSPDEGDLVTRMGRFDVLCTAVLIGPRITSNIDRIQNDIARMPIERTADCLIASAPLGDVGCIVRIVGRSVEQVGRVLGGHLSFVACLLGDDPWARKW